MWRTSVLNQKIPGGLEEQSLSNLKPATPFSLAIYIKQVHWPRRQNGRLCLFGQRANINVIPLGRYANEQELPFLHLFLRTGVTRQKRLSIYGSIEHVYAEIELNLLGDKELHLLVSWGNCKVVLCMSQSQEHRFNTKLRPSWKNREEVNTKHTSKFRCPIDLHGIVR